MEEKLKSWAKDDRVFVSAVVVLVAMASFLLGRISVGQGVLVRSAGGAVASVPVAMTYTGTAVEPATTSRQAVQTPLASPVPRETPVAAGAPAGLYVASRSGSKYHHRDCAGAKRIKDENRIYFATQEEARAAGYEAAANCPQLNN